MQVIKEENSYGSAFRELARQRADEPSWLQRARADAFTRFERVGFPTVHEEDWKYTNTAPIARGDFQPVFRSGSVSSLERNSSKVIHPEIKDGQLMFVNGILQRNLSSVNLPDGVVVTDLADAMSEPRFEAYIRGKLSTDAKSNGFNALNAALFSSGAFVLIPRGVELLSPIEFFFMAFIENGGAPASFPRIVVIAEENSSATIVESYAGSPGAYFTNAVVDLRVQAGARIEHYKTQLEGNSAFHVAQTTAAVARNAKYTTTTINLGGLLSRHDIAVTFEEEGGECAVDGLYLIGSEQHSDTHSVIDHASAHCTSRQLYKGVLDGKSRAVFNGKVFVRHGAQQTDAQQTNKNLLLSEHAHVDTKPQLEIFADDVKCAHGAAIGQLNEDELFYLESRGINPGLARNVLTYGFAEEVIERIKIDSIKRELDHAVLTSLKFSALNN